MKLYDICWFLSLKIFIFISCVWLFYLQVWMNTVCMSSAPRGQKRIINFLELELRVTVNHLLCGCWELNPVSLQEQQLLLTIEPALQPHLCRFLHRVSVASGNAMHGKTRQNLCSIGIFILWKLDFFFQSRLDLIKLLQAWVILIKQISHGSFAFVMEQTAQGSRISEWLSSEWLSEGASNHVTPSTTTHWTHHSYLIKTCSRPMASEDQVQS